MWTGVLDFWLPLGGGFQVFYILPNPNLAPVAGGGVNSNCLVYNEDNNNSMVTHINCFTSKAVLLKKGASQHQSCTYSPITNLGVQVHLYLQSNTLPSQYRIGAEILDSGCLKSRKSEVLASWRAAFGVTFWIQLCWIGLRGGWSIQTTPSMTMMMPMTAWWLR